MSETLANMEKLGGIDYSTEEQWTGLRWIDGKKIYQKTISCGTLPNATSKTLSMGTGIDAIISAKGWAFDGTTSVMLPFLRVPTTSAGSITFMNFQRGAGTFQIVSDTDRSGYTESYITLQYTKTTD